MSPRTLAPNPPLPRTGAWNSTLRPEGRLKHLICWMVYELTADLPALPVELTRERRKRMSYQSILWEKALSTGVPYRAVVRECVRRILAVYPVPLRGVDRGAFQARGDHTRHVCSRNDEAGRTQARYMKGSPPVHQAASTPPARMPRHLAFSGRGRGRYLLRALCAVIPLWIAEAVYAQAPAALVISSTRVCDNCSIRGVRVATIEHGPDHLGYSDRVRAYAAQDGHFFVVDPLTFPAQVIVTDAAGRFLRTLGRFGHGPGEFQQPAVALAHTADSVAVYDLLGRSISVFDRRLQFVRRYIVAQVGITAFAAVLFPDGHLVKNALLMTRESIGYPLHVIDATGAPVRSFGKEVRSSTPASAPSDARLLAVRDDTTFWAAHAYRYEIELWSRTGRRLGSLLRDAPWFPPYQEGSMLHLPRPYIQGVFQDAVGLLWVHIAVPDPRRPAMPRIENNAAAGAARSNATYNTIIEVIDPAAGTLLATARFQQFFHLAIQPGLLVMNVEDADGFESRLHVWRLQLVR
jgi:hypothetical protein